MGTIPNFLPTKVLLFSENKEEKSGYTSIQYTSIWGEYGYSSIKSACKPAGREPCTRLPAGIAPALKL